MTLQHSPGPWTTDFFGRLIYDSQNSAICEIWDDQKRPENSRLIAAAPDMLRLLRAILRNHRAADYGGMIKSLGDAAQFVERLDGDT